jgi:two-component system cell cycle response regulator
MPSVLVVDDSPSIRATVVKLMERLGFEVAEARDGEEGLSTLAECRFDLIVLDMMMPNMDGPTMLAKAREGGDFTPVILLTAESHRPTIASAMRAGVADYVIKPFEPAELCRKVLAVLQGSSCGGAAPVSMPGGAAAAGLWRAPARPERHQFVDLLVVDDMENVSKRLRSMLPKHVTMNGFTCAQSALSAAGEKAYRVVVVDTDIPAIDSGVLAQQMRDLQPSAVVGALVTHTEAARQQVVLTEGGFEFVLCKPFTREEVADRLLPHLESYELLSREENLLRLGPFPGKDEERDRHFGELFRLLPPALREVACASFGEVIVDLGSVPSHPQLLRQLLASTAEQARDLGLDVLAVGSGEARKVLASSADTRAIRCFGSVEEARAAGAQCPPR